MFSYSKGTNKFDNLPVQCSVDTFREFARDVLGSVSPEKGLAYVCAAVSCGLHRKIEKYPKKNHWRQQHLALPRRFLAFDFDGFEKPEVWDELREVFPWRSFFYTTASHTTDAPRARAFVELSRDVDHDEGVELGEAAQAYLEILVTSGWIQFDKSVYQSTQPIYTPVKGFTPYPIKGGVLNVEFLLTQCRAQKAIHAYNHSIGINAPSTSLNSILGPSAEITTPIPSGQRNVTLLSAAGRYRAQGCTQPEIEELVFRDNEQWCDPPIEEDEALSIARRYEQISPFSDETITKKKLSYTFLTTEELQLLPPTRWRVKGLFPDKGIASIYGPSGSGKSFLALDLMAAIALSKTFYSSKTIHCPVVYVALEGIGGIANRIKAYETYHKRKLPPSFRVVTDMLSLFNSEAPVFAEAIKEEGLDGGVIVIDTLAQSAPGSDENSSADMGRIISNAQLLQRETNGLVVLIHHTGKDLRRGARGHSSLYAALDGAIEVRRPQAGREWRRKKVKDGEDGVITPFRLERVVLGIDEDGDEISSCVATGDMFRVEQPKVPTGKNQKALLDALWLKHTKTELIPMTEVLTLAEASLPDQSGNAKQRAKEAVTGLVNLKRLVQEGDAYRVV